MIEEPGRRGACWTLLFLKSREVGNVTLKSRLGCSEHEMVEFQSSKEGRTARSVSRTSVEQTWTSSRTCLIEYHGIELWREEGPKEAD